MSVTGETKKGILVIYRIILQTDFHGYKNVNYKIKNSFFSPEMPKARAKNNFNIIIVHF